MKHTLTIIAALLVLAATPAWANPPGYDSSWTSKEAAEGAITADHAYTECMFHHLWSYARKTKDPARDIVAASHAACWTERDKLLAAMHKAQPTGELDWLDSRDRNLSQTKCRSC